MPTLLLPIRSALMKMEVGQTRKFTSDTDQPKQLDKDIRQFAKAKKLPVETVIEADGVAVKRVQKSVIVSLYPEIDALEVGESHVFELPRALHQRIRLAASNRNRQGEIRLACMAEGDSIRVTRLPISSQEVAEAGNLDIPVRSTKYALDRLGTEPQLRFEVAPPERHGLRLAANRTAVKTGWTIRCRLQDDGSMLVYRTDPGAPQPAQK